MPLPCFPWWSTLLQFCYVQEGGPWPKMELLRATLSRVVLLGCMVYACSIASDASRLLSRRAMLPSFPSAMHKDVVWTVLILDSAWHCPSCDHCHLIYLEVYIKKVSNEFRKSLFDLVCTSEALYDRMMIWWIQGQGSSWLFFVLSTQLVYVSPMTPNVAVLCGIVICVFVSREHPVDCRQCLFSTPLHALH